MRFRTGLSSLLVVLALSVGARAQLSLTGTSAGVDFSGFDGSGFAPMPAGGMLDSDDWRVTGASDGSVDFGQTGTTGDFARDQTTGGVTTGGIYGLDRMGNEALWVQPGGADFTPGSFTLRMSNDLGSPLTSLDLSFSILSLNDQSRSLSLIVETSGDDVTYVQQGGAFATAEAADMTPSITSTPRMHSVTFTPAIPAGGFVYVRFSIDDLAATGSRDEIGLDDILVDNFTTSGGAYPGTGEDLIIESSLNFAAYAETPVASVVANDFVSLRLSSPLNSFLGHNFSILGTVFDHDNGPPVPEVDFTGTTGCPCPGIYAQLAGPINTFVIWGRGNIIGLAIPARLAPGGVSFGFYWPPAMAGTDLLVQGLVHSEGAPTANPYFVTTDAAVLHEM